MSVLGRALRAALCLSVLGTLAAAPARASVTFRFEVEIGSPCLSGSGIPNAEHVVRLRTPDGALRGRFQTMSHERGAWSGCFDLTTPILVQAGDRISANAEGEGRSWRIPRLQAATHRVDDVVHGRAPANSRLTVGYRQQGVEFPTETVTSDADGGFRWRPSIDIRGGGLVSVVYRSPQRDVVRAYHIVPYLELTKNGDLVRGAVNLGAAVEVLLEDAEGDRKGTGQGSGVASGYFALSLRRPDGEPAYVQTGDRVRASLAEDADLRIPRMWLRGDARTDVVEGRCMPDRPYTLVSFDVDSIFVRGRTGIDGTFRRDVSDHGNLLRGDQLTLTCRYSTGDIISFTNTVRD